MSRRLVVFCCFAVAAAVLFVRLGLWQVARLRERQAWTATFLHARQNDPVPMSRIPSDTGLAHYRAATAEGRLDYDHELILSNRTRRGAPGVELLTPLRLAGSDTAVLVNRGWVYSPDGSSVNESRWREGDAKRFAGYVELFHEGAGVTSASNPRTIRRVGTADIASKIPYPVSPFYLVATGDTADLSHPARRDLPVLDDGPHLGYALQWFSFAVIALGGAGFVVRRERDASSRPQRPPV